MTLREIKAMFAPGQQWHAVRTGGGPHRDEIRRVCAVRSKYLVFGVNGNPGYFTDWPKAGEVVEARPGFLRFAYHDCPGVEVTLTRVDLCQCELCRTERAATEAVIGGGA